MKVFPEKFREQFLCQHGKIGSLKWKINIYNLETQTQTSYYVSDQVTTLKQESCHTPEEQGLQGGHAGVAPLQPHQPPSTAMDLKRTLGKAVYFCDVARKPTRASHL